MGKVNYRKVPAQKRARMKMELREVLKGLGMGEHAWDFFCDVLTESEMIMFARRLEIARWLLAGHPHDIIAGQLGVGLTTVYSVDRWLERRFESYREELEPLFRKSDMKTLRKFGTRLPVDLHSLRGLRKRYPADFLLLNLLLGDPNDYERND
jgi:uncharacterized protein YerC